MAEREFHKLLLHCVGWNFKLQLGKYSARNWTSSNTSVKSNLVKHVLYQSFKKKKSNISALFRSADVTENITQLESKYDFSSGFGCSEEHTWQWAAVRLLPLSPAPCFPPSCEAEELADDLSPAILSQCATSWQIEILVNKLSKSLPPRSHFETGGQPTWKAKNMLVRLVVNKPYATGLLKGVCH